MRKLATIAVALAAGTAYGISVGAGGFYAVSKSYVFDFIWESYHPSLLGVGGKVSVGVLPALSVDVGFGYNAKYKGGMPWLDIFRPEHEDPDNWYLTTIPITFGASYKFDLGKFKPYVGAGGVFAVRKRHYEVDITPEAPDPTFEPRTYTVNKPGFYAGGGIMYGLTDKLFLDANPRFWMMMYDEAEDADAPPSIGKDEGSSIFADFLIGVDYFFM